MDPEQSYYRDISYRASGLSHNLSATTEQPNWDPDTQCMDSTQMWFCRDLWTDAAKSAIKEGKRGGHHKLAGDPTRPLGGHHGHVGRRDPGEGVTTDDEVIRFQDGNNKDKEKRQEDGGAAKASDEEGGTDVDAIDEEAGNPAPEPLKPQDLPASAFLIPNSEFTPARILVNPRCVTTYGGVSHTQLALDLFGTGSDDEEVRTSGKYVLDDWLGPPDSFVCQEMRTTGGRTAPKSQRRVGFLLQNEVRVTVSLV